MKTNLSFAAFIHVGKLLIFRLKYILKTTVIVYCSCVIFLISSIIQIVLLLKRVCGMVFAWSTGVNNGWIQCLCFHLFKVNEQANLLRRSIIFS